MRIAKIDVQGLFGLFSYPIPLKLQDRITIIHGPNGCGKTTILRVLFNLFAKRFGELSATRFEQLHIAFENGQELKIVKTIRDRPAGVQGGRRRSREQPQLEFTLLSDENQKPWTWVGIGERLEFPLTMIEAHLGFLSRVEERLWHDRRTGEAYALEDIIAKFGERLPFLPQVPGQEMPQWLRAIVEGVEVHFIQTQRLLRLASSGRETGERAGHRAMVLEYSEEAVARIRTSLAESVQQSQRLDRNFPVRVITERGSTNVTSDQQVREKYQEQQKKGKRLEAAGLIGWQLEVPLPEKELEIVERQLLWLYLEDMDRKLGGFDELLQKIEVLTDMINARFLNKTFKIDREKGFVFTGMDGSRIPLESLSSGEQHELVLSYELLFRVKRGSMIMIDEPELSLHVAWQHRFLDDLGRISELAGLDFLVATHSPQIIHKRWDLALSLGETE